MKIDDFDHEYHSGMIEKYAKPYGKMAHLVKEGKGFLSYHNVWADSQWLDAAHISSEKKCVNTQKFSVE